MSSPINIPAILIANIMGLTILFTVALGNAWRLKERSKKNNCLTTMFFASIVNCIADPVCFLADGKAGAFNRFLVVGGNSCLYLCGIIIAFAWIQLIVDHMDVRLPALHRNTLLAILAIVAVLLIANLFTPVLFYVDENNVYARLGGYAIYNVCYVGFLLDGLLLYFWEKRVSGCLKFFPVWAFVVPASIGIVIQVFFYGVSTVTPFATISIVGVILSLQNEFMIRDKLTGLYNRFYLDMVEKRLREATDANYMAIMLDINGFKQINDTYGHKVGDDALRVLARILVNVVGREGEVIRYAGDEFLIFLHAHDEAQTQQVISRIHDSLEKYNNQKDNDSFTLSIAMGYCKLDMKESTMDAFEDHLDKLMYENKEDYYCLHSQYDRSKNCGSAKME